MGSSSSHVQASRNNAAFNEVAKQLGMFKKAVDQLAQVSPAAYYRHIMCHLDCVDTNLALWKTLEDL
jgi:hypothetical protein